LTKETSPSLETQKEVPKLIGTLTIQPLTNLGYDKPKIEISSKELIVIEHIGEKSSSSIVHILSNDSFFDSNILFKNVNQLHTFHRENDFHHTCYFVQRFLSYG